MEKIKAIAYFCNGIGNLVMMMPALQAVSTLTENNKIDIILGDYRDNRKSSVLEILKSWQVIENIYIDPIDKIDPQQYSLWFYSPHNQNSDVTLIFRENQTHRPIPKPRWRDSLIHEIDHYMEIAYSMGYRGPIPQVMFPLPYNPILTYLERPIIGLCNGWFRIDYWKKKEWPYFKRLSEVLKRYFGGTIIGIGNEGELDGVYLDINYCGKLSILETARVISQLDLLITTDTGNMHIADILDIPLIALFGPTLVSKNGPRSKNATVLLSGVECAPCQEKMMFHSCKDYVCMKKITVGDVVATAKEKI